jgi:hypothetical protein
LLAALQERPLFIFPSGNVALLLGRPDPEVPRGAPATTEKRCLILRLLAAGQAA